MAVNAIGCGELGLGIGTVRSTINGITPLLLIALPLVGRAPELAVVLPLASSRTLILGNKLQACLVETSRRTTNHPGRRKTR